MIVYQHQAHTRSTIAIPCILVLLPWRW